MPDRMKKIDPDALPEILDRLRPRLQKLARRELAGELRARVRTSDLLQATYLDILQSLPAFRGTTEDELVAWMIRILRNNARDAVKYHRAAKRLAPGGRPEAALDAEGIRGRGPTPSAETAFVDDLLLVGKALERLPADYRRVIVLHARLQGSHRDLARELDRSEGATRVLLSRARAALLLELDRGRRKTKDD